MNVVVRLTLFICLQNYAYLFETLFSSSPIYHPIEHSNIYPNQILLKYLVRGDENVNPDQKCLKYLVRGIIWSGRAKNNTDQIFRDRTMGFY